MAGEMPIPTTMVVQMTPYPIPRTSSTSLAPKPMSMIASIVGSRILHLLPVEIFGFPVNSYYYQKQRFGINPHRFVNTTRTGQGRSNTRMPVTSREAEDSIYSAFLLTCGKKIACLSHSLVIPKKITITRLPLGFPNRIAFTGCSLWRQDEMGKR